MAIFLHEADETWYSGLKSILAQNMSKGSNQYPQTTEEALNILNIYSKTMKYQHERKTYTSEDRRTN